MGVGVSESERVRCTCGWVWVCECVGVCVVVVAVIMVIVVVVVPSGVVVVACGIRNGRPVSFQIKTTRRILSVFAFDLCLA